jgi:uncharacterized membrane protein
MIQPLDMQIKKQITIKEKIEIQAPIEEVWQVFSMMEEWKNWNMVCQECCYISGDSLAEGTCFSFVIRPYYLPLKVTPRVIECTPGKYVAWEGSRLGIHARHEFVFEPKKDAILLTSIEIFHGPMLWLCRWLNIPGRLHRLSRQMMSAIKQQTENCHRLETRNKNREG